VRLHAGQVGAAQRFKAVPAYLSPTGPGRFGWIGRLFLVISFLLNVLLATVLVALFLFFQSKPGSLADELAPGEGTGSSAKSLMFSSYCVVLQTDGSIREKVAALLRELFSDVTEVSRSEAQRDKLLQVTKSKVVEGFAD
jgi:hypothetical protein